MAQVVYLEVKALARKYGLERLGFLTLTFRDHVVEIAEASRRFNNVNRRVLSARYERAVATVERQRSSRLHFHLLTVHDCDIRTGLSFGAVERGDYRSASPALRAEWAFWRKTAPAYGFGRTELLPVKSTDEAVARYVGKYLSKHIGQREERDRGARVVRFLGYKPEERTASSRFFWATPNGWLWRHKLKAFCQLHGFESTEALSQIYGRRWCFYLQWEIMSTPIHDVFPSEAVAVASMDATNLKNIHRSLCTKWRDSRQFGRDYQLKPYEQKTAKQRQSTHS